MLMSVSFDTDPGRSIGKAVCRRSDLDRSSTIRPYNCQRTPVPCSRSASVVVRLSHRLSAAKRHQCAAVNLHADRSGFCHFQCPCGIRQMDRHKGDGTGCDCILLWQYLKDRFCSGGGERDTAKHSPCGIVADRGQRTGAIYRRKSARPCSNGFLASNCPS